MRIPPGPSRRTFSVWFVLIALVVGFGSRVSAQVPANDAFASRATLSGISTVVSASTLNATAEAGEPAHAGNTAAKSVWWQWTAPQSGRVSIDTFGSAIDTVVAVYRGTTLSGLTAIAFNDEAGGTHASAVVFYAVAGTTYLIAVDGYQGAAGSIALRLISTSSADLYSTDFESFTVGGDTLIGTDGWSSTSFGNGTSGIVQSSFFGSRAAFVGFNTTPDSLVSAWRPLGVLPVAGFTPTIRFSVDLAVIDSTDGNGKRDAFFFILYNASGQLLAALNFDNAGQRIYRFDGTTYRDVGAFVRGTRYALTASLNFTAGTWSATLGGATLFTDQQINVQSRALSLGFVSASWVIATAGSPGDNYLLFDNYRLTILNPPVGPSITRQPINRTVVAKTSATFSVQANGSPGPAYQWEMSTDGGTSWAPVTSNGAYTGESSSLLTIPSTTLAMSGYLFRCVINNGLGANVVSDVAGLTVTPSQGATAVSAGTSHLLFVLMDGTLWATGDNSFGQLGDGTNTGRSTPVQIASNVVAVSAGHAFSLFLKSDGTLWGMGENVLGQLGDGTTVRRSVPLQITTNVAMMAAGFSHTLFLKTDGTLWATGGNESGQLGDGTTVNRSTPAQIASGVIGVAAAGSHSFFIKADRTLWAMGGNIFGDLGDGTFANRTSPVKIAGQVVSANGGSSHSGFITSGGALWTMGLNSQMQLGDGTNINRPSPVKVAASASSLDGGNNFTLFVDPNRNLWAMGANSSGQLGFGGNRSVPGIIATEVIVASAGDSGFTAYISNEGTLYAMGANASGQLGSGASGGDQRSPVAIQSGVLMAPAAPAGLFAADQGMAGVRIAWSPAVGSMRYEVWRNTTDSFATATRVAADLTATLVYDTSAAVGTTYYYWAKASNPAGTSGFSTGSIGITPVAAVPFVEASPASRTIDAGSRVTFSVAAVSNVPISYQWRKGGATIVGATNEILAFESVQPDHAGNYDVVVSSSAGSATSAIAVLTVNDIARFAAPPLSRVVTVGSAIDLGMTVVGAAPVSIAWKRNGQTIAGATSAMLTLPSVTSDDQGFYEVTVTNTFGGSWSTFRLDVGPADGAVVAWGNNQFGQTSVPSIPNDVVAISAGSSHALALRAGGTVRGWGLAGPATAPAGLSNIVAISGGTSHSLALTSEGTVVAWGDNAYGQAAVPAGLGKVVAIAASYLHSVALRTDGTVVAWGSNANGQCAVPADLGRVVAVAAVASFTMALKADGTVVEWGLIDYYGHVPSGLGQVQAISAGTPILALRSDRTLVGWGTSFGYGPFQVDGRSTNEMPEVKRMSSGGGHGLALKTDGTLVAFGIDRNGATIVPAGVANAAAVAAGGAFSMALMQVTAPPVLGSVPSTFAAPAGAAANLSIRATGFGLSYRWQRQAAGSALWNDVSEGPVYSGVSTASLVIKPVTAEMSGETFRCVVSNSRGTVISDGVTLTVKLAPVTAVSSGDGYALVVQSDGSLWSTGYIRAEQLGDGTFDQRLGLNFVVGNVESVSANSGISLFRKRDGSLWAMGTNDFGQLGVGVSTYRATPVPVPIDAVAMAAGYSHSLFLKVDGTLWAVGRNDEGQLGDGTTTDRPGFVQVASGVAKIAAGASHSAFVKTDGTLWTMGANSYGQLGDGTFTRRLSPVQVATDVTAIASGANHLAISKVDGRLFAVGININGQLGDGSTTNRSVPVQIATGVTSASAGYYHTMFVRADGSLWGHGWSIGGAVGDGTNETRLSPVQVATQVAFVNCGGVQSYFVKTDGSLWAMGRNLFGDLGDGTLINRPTPVRITASIAPSTPPTSISASDGLFADKVSVAWLPVPGAVRYELWRHTSNSPTTATRLADNLTTLSFVDSTVVLGVTYYYWVKAGNDGGTSAFGASDAGFVGVPVAPALDTAPVGQVVAAGASFTLTAAASGLPIPAYQWRRNTVDIPGATSATFTRPNAQLADAGAYTVYISNSAGNVTSPPVTVSVIPPGTTAQHAVVRAGYTAGGTVTISNTLAYVGAATGASWQVLLPAGWTFASSSSPTATSSPASGAAHLAEWSWSSPPTGPLAFSYTLNVPAGTTGNVSLVASASVVQSGATIPLIAQPDPLVIASLTTRHAADSNGDGKIDLFELTRVIELYNVRSGTVRTGAYTVATTATEDGFASDATRSGPAVLVRYHSADTNKDARFGLIEVTRVIEFFNTRSGTARTGAYRVSAGSEDGFAPAP